MLNLTGLSLLSYQRSNQFFGDIFRYASHDELTLEGDILSLENTYGAEPILYQLSGMERLSTDWQPIIINSQFFNFARINSVNYQPSVDVQIKKYSISATIFNSGNLYNLSTTDPLYSGLNLNNPIAPIYLVESFSEDFTTNVASNGDFSEQQSIKLKMVSGAAAGNRLNPIGMAQQLSANLISSNPAIGFINSFYSGYKQKYGKRTHAETINLISNEYSITESFKTLKDISGSYSLNYSHSLQLDEMGITTIKEDGKVQGLYPDFYNNYYPAALSGMLYEVGANSFNRCNDLFTHYSNEIPYPLNPKFIVYGQNLNKFTDNVGYNITYNNDPKVNNTYIWEYTQHAERNPGECSWNIIEDGSILGVSLTCSPIEKYGNALAAYNNIKTGIAIRTFNYYTGVSNFYNPLKLLTQGESSNKIHGDIKYNQRFSDDLRYSISGFKKLEYNISDDFAFPLVNKFGILGVKEIAQPANISTLSKRNLNISINGYRGTPLSSYLTAAQNEANSFIPSGIDPYIDNLSYSFNPLIGNFNLTCGWSYQPSSPLDMTNFIIL